jgi:hypothetical protein
MKEVTCEYHCILTNFHRVIHLYVNLRCRINYQSYVTLITALAIVYSSPTFIVPVLNITSWRYGVLEINPYTFLTSALDGGQLQHQAQAVSH